MRCFELGLVHTHGRKRNLLLPGVRVLGLDDPTEKMMTVFSETLKEGSANLRQDFDVSKLNTRHTVKGRYWK